MKRRWKMARVGCGTPAVPLESWLSPSFKALKCKDLKPLSFFLVSATPLMGDTAMVYVCIHVRQMNIIFLGQNAVEVTP